VTFQGLLQSEFDRRHTANGRYSLRSFARFLSLDHSTLSQILRGKRRLTPRNVCAIGRKLGLAAAVIAEHCAAENDAAVLAALNRPGFRADSRWLSTMIGLPLDEVNIALQRLLRKRRLVMSSRGSWLRVEEDSGKSGGAVADRGERS
jgi:transcriptional regulator with XRE-family HTH domain